MVGLKTNNSFVIFFDRKMENVMVNYDQYFDY